MFGLKHAVQGGLENLYAVSAGRHELHLELGPFVATQLAKLKPSTTDGLFRVHKGTKVILARN